jgi:hypothetical protein
LDPGEYGLIVSKGKKTIAFTFTKAELTAGYGTGGWARRLRAKAGTSRIDALTREQTPQDRATRIHRLVLCQGSEKSIFTFTEYELLDNYGSKQWRKELRGHIGDILMELEDDRKNR